MDGFAALQAEIPRKPAMTPPETPENRLKRLKMRSWRRGTKEMDLILGPFADHELGGLGAVELDLFDALLSENDQDLYPWITGASLPPPRFGALLDRIGAFARVGPRRS
jgi:antitoxin CptB